MMKILGEDEVEEIEKIIEKNYGGKINLKAYAVGITSKEKVWIMSKKICELDWSRLRVNAKGLYFAKLKKGGKIRFSTEGAQLVGKVAKRNVAVLDEENAKKFLRGLEARVKSCEGGCEEKNFVLVKFGEDFVGCGKFSEGKVESFVPKGRRLPLES